MKSLSIIGYPDYFVTSNGYIFSRRRKIFLLPSYNIKGYMRVMLYNKLGRKRFFVHRLVATAFIHKGSLSYVVDHIDENIHNNSVSNLRWCSQSENIQASIDRKNKKLKDECPF